MKKSLLFMFTLALFTILVVSCGTSKRGHGCRGTRGMSGY